MGFAIGADIPRRQNKAAKECHKFVFHNLSNCFEVRVNFGRVVQPPRPQSEAALRNDRLDETRDVR